MNSSKAKSGLRGFFCVLAVLAGLTSAPTEGAMKMINVAVRVPKPMPTPTPKPTFMLYSPAFSFSSANIDLYYSLNCSTWGRELSYGVNGYCTDPNAKGPTEFAAVNASFAPPSGVTESKYLYSRINGWINFDNWFYGASDFQTNYYYARIAYGSSPGPGQWGAFFQYALGVTDIPYFCSTVVGWGGGKYVFSPVSTYIGYTLGNNPASNDAIYSSSIGTFGTTLTFSLTCMY